MKRFRRDKMADEVVRRAYEERYVEERLPVPQRRRAEANEERSMIPRAVVPELERYEGPASGVTDDVRPYRMYEFKPTHTDQTKKGWWITTAEKNKIPTDGSTLEKLIQEGTYKGWSNESVPLGTMEGEDPVNAHVGRVRPEEREAGGRGLSTDYLFAERRNKKTYLPTFSDEDVQKLLDLLD